MSVAYVQDMVVGKDPIDARTAFRVSGFVTIQELARAIAKEFQEGVYRVRTYWDLGDDVVEFHDFIVTYDEGELLFVNEDGPVGKFEKNCETTS